MVAAMSKSYTDEEMADRRRLVGNRRVVDRNEDVGDALISAQTAGGQMNLIRQRRDDWGVRRPPNYSTPFERAPFDHDAAIARALGAL